MILPSKIGNNILVSRAIRPFDQQLLISKGRNNKNESRLRKKKKIIL